MPGSSHFYRPSYLSGQPQIPARESTNVMLDTASMSGKRKARVRAPAACRYNKTDVQSECGPGTKELPTMAYTSLQHTYVCKEISIFLRLEQCYLGTGRAAPRPNRWHRCGHSNTHHRCGWDGDKICCRFVHRPPHKERNCQSSFETLEYCECTFLSPCAGNDATRQNGSPRSLRTAIQ